MRLAILLTLSLLATAVALAPAASAGPEWLPVCKDKDVRAANTHVHVGVDCYPGIWISHCPAVGDGACYHWEVALV